MLVWAVALLGIGAWVGFGGALGPACRFHELTGWHCPGCGGTRALRSLLHGDVIAALRMNALVVPGILILVWLLIRGFRARGAVSPIAILGDVRKFLALIVMLVLFTVLRNLPVFPFTELAPH